jgi:hypothetical protein
MRNVARLQLRWWLVILPVLSLFTLQVFGCGSSTSPQKVTVFRAQSSPFHTYTAIHLPLPPVLPRYTTVHLPLPPVLPRYTTIHLPLPPVLPRYTTIHLQLPRMAQPAPVTRH